MINFVEKPKESALMVMSKDERPLILNPTKDVDAEPVKLESEVSVETEDMMNKKKGEVCEG